MGFRVWGVGIARPSAEGGTHVYLRGVVPLHRAGQHGDAGGGPELCLPTMAAWLA